MSDIRNEVIKINNVIVIVKYHYIKQQHDLVKIDGFQRH
jgi:hypothetical protein